MSKPGDNGDNESGVDRHRCAVVTLTLDMTSGQLTIGGSCPTHELARALCQMGADEAERKIAERRAKHLIEVASPSFPLRI